MPILRELYDGNINPSERYIKKGGEYQRLNIQLIDCIEEFIPQLNNEQKKLFEEIQDKLYALGYISEKESFVEGFRIGAQMIWEIIGYKSTDFI